MSFNLYLFHLGWVFFVAELGVLRCCGFTSPFAGMTCVRRAVVIDCLSGERSTNKAARFAIHGAIAWVWEREFGQERRASWPNMWLLQERSGLAECTASAAPSVRLRRVLHVTSGARAGITCKRVCGCWRAGPKRAGGGLAEGAAPPPPLKRRRGHRLRGIAKHRQAEARQSAT